MIVAGAGGLARPDSAAMFAARASKAVFEDRDTEPLELTLRSNRKLREHTGCRLAEHISGCTEHQQCLVEVQRILRSLPVRVALPQREHLLGQIARRAGNALLHRCWRILRRSRSGSRLPAHASRALLPQGQRARPLYLFATLEHGPHPTARCEGSRREPDSTRSTRHNVSRLPRSCAISRHAGRWKMPARYYTSGSSKTPDPHVSRSPANHRRARAAISAMRSSSHAPGIGRS